MSRVLSIDYGMRRCGIAVSDDSCKISLARVTLENNNKLFSELTRIIDLESIGTIVVGYPIGLDGKKTSQTLKVDKFIDELKRYLLSVEKDIEVITYDERLTSRMAKASMLEFGIKKKQRRDKSRLDLISATILLQNYLDSVNKRKHHDPLSA